MYRYRYINKHNQFEQVTYTLILEDLEDQMPIVRLEKAFNIPHNMIDDELLYAEAKREIIKAQQDYNDWFANQVVEDNLVEE